MALSFKEIKEFYNEKIDEDILDSLEHCSTGLIEVQELRNIRKLKEREIELIEESLQLNKEHLQSAIELNRRQIEAIEAQTKVYMDATEKSIQAFDGLKDIEVKHTHTDG